MTMAKSPTWQTDSDRRRRSTAPVEQLNEALNLIGFYCRDNMPDGFEFRLHITNKEMRCEVEEPDGDDAEGWEADESNPVVDACDYANHAQYD